VQLLKNKLSNNILEKKSYRRHRDQISINFVISACMERRALDQVVDIGDGTSTWTSLIQSRVLPIRLQRSKINC